MTAEGMPQVEPSLLAHPLGLATKLAVRFPWFIIGAAVVLAVLSVAWTAKFLGFRTSRLDLLNPESAYNQRWLAYLDEFGDDDDAVVIVESEGQERILPVVEELASTISRQPEYFHSVLYRVDLSPLRSKGLHFLTVDQLHEVDRLLRQVEPVLEGQWNAIAVDKQCRTVSDQLATGASSLSSAHPPAEMAGRFQLLMQGLTAALSESTVYQSLWPDTSGLAQALKHFDTQYLLTSDGRLGLILLRIVRSEGQFAQGSEAIDRLRELIQQAQLVHPEVRIGLTGMPVLENDEMRASQEDMLRATILSLFGVACLFVAGFGGLRHPMLTVVTVILAIGWSFGYVTLAIGHLNILSVSFGVILIGLGIDFGVHYVAQYLQFRRSRLGSEPALIKTAISVGPGVLTGGITTALAFSTAALTDFTGIAELGLIAGGGILMCIVAALVVLPAMIHVMDQNRSTEKIPELLPLDWLLQPLFRVPRLTLVVSIGLTVASAWGVFRLRYDHNLLNLQPENLESVAWERRLIAGTNHSVWFGLSMADNPARARQLKQQFEQLETVDRVEEVASLLPQTSAEKLAIIRRIAQRLTGLPDSPPVIPIAAMEQLDGELTTVQQRAAETSQTKPLVPFITQMRSQLRDLNPRDYYRRISHYQQFTCADLLDRLQSIRSLADPGPPSVDDLPASLQARFVGKNDRFLIKVFARGDIWDMDRLHRFVADLESVDPHITGHPVQTYYASRQMQQSYIHAAIYSLLAVTIVLVLDFCNLRLVLLALLPVLLGMLQLFGLLGLLDIPLNAANMIVLPLILGIGIDDGVHVLHDLQRQSGQYHLSRSTATAVLITSITTMVGFGVMMFANHQGLRSLGQVLTIGVFCCLGTSIIILPALLTWLTRRQRETSRENGLRLTEALDNSRAATRARSKVRDDQFSGDVNDDTSSPLTGQPVNVRQRRSHAAAGKSTGDHWGAGPR